MSDDLIERLEELKQRMRTVFSQPDRMTINAAIARITSAEKMRLAQTAIGAELDALGIEVELRRIPGSPHPEGDKDFRVRIVAALAAGAQAAMKGTSTA
jgi:hypothetical protein